eukprot:2951919-Pyramimonas_sp.AAC.1
MATTGVDQTLCGASGGRPLAGSSGGVWGAYLTGPWGGGLEDLRLYIGGQRGVDGPHSSNLPLTPLGLTLRAPGGVGSKIFACISEGSAA